MVTFIGPATANTRLALLPLTVILSAPGPFTARLPRILSWPLVSAMVPVKPAAKLIVSAPGLRLDRRTACRSEPAPLSLRFSTVKVLGSVRSSRGISRGTKERRAVCALAFAARTRHKEAIDMADLLFHIAGRRSEESWQTAAYGNEA